MIESLANRANAIRPYDILMPMAGCANVIDCNLNNEFAIATIEKYAQAV